MADELKPRFVRARLAAILEHELRECGNHEVNAHVAIARDLGYFVAIEDGDSVTIRLVGE